MPPFRGRVTASRSTHLSLDYFDEIGPPTRLLLGHLLEVDYVPMMRMRRAVVDFLAAEVGVDSFGVPRILVNQLVHERDGVGNATLVGVVEREPHPKDDSALKTFVGVPG